MAYVPGFTHEIFLSYAHGDDREWVLRFVDRLRQSIKPQLGVSVKVWIDEADVHRSRSFEADIPSALRSSAVFLFLPSPSYIRSSYCVGQECRVHLKSIDERRQRFDASEFANELFAFSCPILPVDKDEHRSLFRSLTDTPFFDENGLFRIDSRKFDAALAALAGQVIALLKRMRNHLTPVFLYPHKLERALVDVRDELGTELTAHGYRVLPDREVNLEGQVREAALSVFLLGGQYDQETLNYAQIAADQIEKPWLVWASPSAKLNGSAKALGLIRSLEQMKAVNKTFLNDAIGPTRMKEEVLALLKPAIRDQKRVNGKPRVYVVYNARDTNDRANAGLILLSAYGKVIDFEEPDDPAQHTARIMECDGVLLVWGSADSSWYTQEFTGMMHGARIVASRGVCLFEPKALKEGPLHDSRDLYSNLFVSEQYGRFDAGQLDAFFGPILRRSQATP